MEGWIGIGLLGAVVAAVALVWPRGGVLGRVRRLRREAERVRLEDGLKHLLICERTGRTCTLESLAGAVAVSRGAALDVLTRLTERGLAFHGRGGFVLTEVGRAYALRILRTHRLWERYLADRTGVPAGAWHAEAERVEHRLSAEEADELAARLGYPRYDPHGDPIPTAGGEIPAPVGTPLTVVDAGDRVVVLHVEDEPGSVFDRLTAAGVAPGLVLEVLGPSAGRSAGSPASGPAAGSVRVEGRGSIRIRARGRELELRPVDAANVTVEVVPDGAGAGDTEPPRTLADAGVSEVVQVVGIAPACQGPQRRRLLDLGVVPGTRITPELVSASGDPVAYRIRGALIALRREQAAWIEVGRSVVEKAS